MRPLLPGDLDLATRVLMAAPRARWPALARSLIGAADAGEAHRMKFGRGHRRFGSGSVAAAAAAFDRAPLPETCDRDYLSALSVFIHAILKDGDPGSGA